MERFKQLTLKEYLKLIPSSFVFQYLAKGIKTQRKIVSAELINSIEERLLTEESFVSRFEKLSAEAKKVCALAYLFGGSGIEFWEHTEYHEELLSSFLIYAVQNKNDSKNFYTGLLDSAQKHYKSISQFICDDAGVSGTFSANSFLRYRCLNDIAMVLIFALKGMIKRKRDGGILQSVFDELKNKLHTTAETCIFEKKDADIRRIIDVILVYGQKNGILAQTDKQYTTTTQQITQWLSKTPKELSDDFYRFAVEYSGSWDMKIFGEILNCAGDSWLSTAFFPDQCRHQVIGMLQLMHYTGGIEAVAQGREIFWRRAPGPGSGAFGGVKHAITVLPDFSAILPQEAAPELLYTFSLVGTYTVLDKVYKGVINRTTINQSLTFGIKGGELLQNLAGWGAPENVIETVREWIREYSRLYVLAADFIVVCDQKTSSQLSSFQPLMGIMEPVESYSVFRIKQGYEKEVKELLEEMGFDPRVPQSQVSDSVPEGIGAIESESDTECELLFDLQEKKEEQTRSMKTGKYSEELKVLDLSEIHHVIHYALLMGYQLKFEYEGSPHIKRGIYTVTPVSVTMDKEPVLEAKKNSEAVKKYYVRKIARIGVKSI